MNRPRHFLVALLCLCLSSAALAQKKPQSTKKSRAASVANVVRFEPLDAAINKAIADRQIPGAVLLIGHKGKVV
jgi:ABC-type oligopeptide transport system substrate-binding subunit